MGKRKYVVNMTFIFEMVESIVKTKENLVVINLNVTQLLIG